MDKAGKEIIDAAIIEKTSILLMLLEEVALNATLQNRVCLHGGTALNLFILDSPRLSLDADLNYIGSVQREVMLKERFLVDEALHKIAQGLSFRMEAGSDEHAGRTYKMIYTSDVTGQRDFVKVDMDYLNRSPLLPVVRKESTWGEKSGVAIPLNAPIEIAGGKMMALFGRVVPRDLYDMASLAKNRQACSTGDTELDRKVMLFYLSLSDSFPRPIAIRKRFGAFEEAIEKNLIPVLLNGDHPKLDDMIEAVEDYVGELTTPKTDNERAYLEEMRNANYKPELLFDGYPEVLEAAKENPRMMWKLQNLKKNLISTPEKSQELE
ncbi:MAG: nucleotidyl transferase AbiEii/AbiGii toxin family protein [Coriobacteriales bacterium]|jgi:predicted nucleotidyltransferase component of viral defense system|nr:nucleotidyl transferase AbiEii/AbiGii toxin family protein [Coriobacteriales bacterium]